MSAPSRVYQQQPALAASLVVLDWRAPPPAYDFMGEPPPAFDTQGCYAGQDLPPLPQSPSRSITIAVPVLSPDRVSNSVSGRAGSREDEERIKAIAAVATVGAAAASAAPHRALPSQSYVAGSGKEMEAARNLEYAAKISEYSAKDGNSRADRLVGVIVDERTLGYAAKAAASDLKAIAAAPADSKDDSIFIRFCWNISFGDSTNQKREKLQQALNSHCNNQSRPVTVKADLMRKWLSGYSFASVADTVRVVGARLPRIPPEISCFSAVTWLDLNNNVLTSFPLEILSLTHLEVLNLKDNQLSELPAQISQMSNLRTLFLGNNKRLAELPKELYQLPKLKGLYIMGTKISFEHLEAHLPTARTLKYLSVSADIYQRIFDARTRLIPNDCELSSDLIRR